MPMIFSRHSGYSADGRRILPVGGGVGEAMLIGAAVGGGSAAITGGDPLKGALLGGLTGGAGAGISGALAGTSAATTAAATAPAVTEAAMANALPLTATGNIAATAAPTTLASTGALPQGMSFAQASQAANQAANLAGNAAIQQGTNAAMTNALPLTANAGMPFSSAVGTGGISDLAATGSSAAPSSFQTAMQSPLNYIKANPLTMASAGIAGATGARRPMEEEEEYKGPLSRFRFNPETYRPAFADGGIASLPYGYDRVVGEQPMYQRMAQGGISDLGTYSDGGRMLRGPGDGMSDSIPGMIGGKRPARLADGEFVVPADVVSGLGNGSTDAGARHLYAMMDKVRTARTGTKKQGREINARKYMPA